MRSDGRPRRTPALIGDSVRALLFRREAIRKLLSSETLLLPILYLVIGTSLDLIIDPVAHQSSQSLVNTIILAPIFGLVLTAYWALAVLAVGEPVLTLLVKISEDDPLLLLRPDDRRPAARTACLTALAIPFLLAAALKPIYAFSPTAVLLSWFAAALLGFALLVRMLAVYWRFAVSTSAVIATGPFAVAIGLATALSEPLAAAAATLIMIPLLWPATGDIRRRMVASHLTVQVLKHEKLENEALEPAIEAISEAHSPKQAGIMLEMLNEKGSPQLRDEYRISLLSAAGRYLEAVEAGVAALEAGRASGRLHVALAEACLFSDDPENAAAHAQEAYELGLGPRALLILAAALFRLRETESGIEACRRILAMNRRGRHKVAKSVLRGAKLLLRRIETAAALEL